MQIQIDALGVEFLQDADKIDQRSAQPRATACSSSSRLGRLSRPWRRKCPGA
jgi:hypothetical protein